MLYDRSMPKEDFREGYLDELANTQDAKALIGRTPSERLLVSSGALLNWTGEWINDTSVTWTFQTLKIDDITLTGMGQDWNEINLERAGKSPAKLRELIDSDPAVREKVQTATSRDFPILIRKEEDKLKVLDGMNRVISAVRDGKNEIEAYVGKRTGEAKPVLEPHVIYDFIRSYKQQRGDALDFRGGLRFLVANFANARDLLLTRFSDEWVRDEEISKIIKEITG